MGQRKKRKASQKNATPISAVVNTRRRGGRAGRLL